MTDFYHLDEPWFVEFGFYVKNVATLQFGPSLVDRYHSVDDAVKEGFPVTGQLILLAAAWAIPVGMLLGLFAAVRRSSALDHLATSAASVLLVVPVFFVTYVLSRYLVYEWDVFPLDWDTRQGKVLPVLALGLAPAGYAARLTRAAAVTRSSPTTSAPHGRRASAGRGHRRARAPQLVRAAALRDAADARAPRHRRVLRRDGVQDPRRLGGVRPGRRAKDYPMILGLTVALTVLVLVVNLIADVLMAIIDPRLREEAP